MRIPPLLLERADVVAPADGGPAWVGAAACAGSSTARFFEGPTAGAVAVCRTCPVAGECADYALSERLTDGVWGGLTGDDRREVAKLRGITWEPKPPPARSLCVCGRFARPQRRFCSACAQRNLRASRA